MVIAFAACVTLILFDVLMWWWRIALPDWYYKVIAASVVVGLLLLAGEALWAYSSVQSVAR